MRYGLAILITIFLLIVGAVVFVGSNNSSSPTTSVRNTKLADYENSDHARITWTQQGRLVGDDRRKAIRVTVTRSKRTIEILDGFAERVEQSRELANTPEAFSAFVRALDTANFGRERNVKQPDERGVCALGNRFIYRLTDSGKEVMRTWSDSCLRSDGPFGGGGNTAAQIASLFKAQITDYSKTVSGIRL